MTPPDNATESMESTAAMPTSTDVPRRARRTPRLESVTLEQGALVSVFRATYSPKMITVTVMDNGPREVTFNTWLILEIKDAKDGKAILAIRDRGFVTVAQSRAEVEALIKE